MKTKIVVGSLGLVLTTLGYCWYWLTMSMVSGMPPSAMTSLYWPATWALLTFGIGVLLLVVSAIMFFVSWIRKSRRHAASYDGS